MKKILLIAVLFFIISCKSQKSKVNDTCKVTEIENFEEFDKIHANIDTTSFYKKEIDEFEKIDTGVLLCNLFPIISMETSRL